MNPSGNASSDFSNKPKNRASVGENSANPNTVRDPKHSAGPSSGNGSWQEGHKEHHRERGTKREKSGERDWSRDRDRSHVRQRENFCNEESREECEGQPVFHNYEPKTDPNYVENNQQPLSMSDMQAYGMMAAINSSQWSMGPMEGMNNMNSPAAMNANPVVDMNTNAGVSMNPFNFMGMPADSNLYGMMGMGNYGQYGMVGGGENNMIAPTKEVLHFSKCVLYPPNPNAAPPTTREKPPGCKTVFVGGLPENATEAIVREVFEKCGNILTIRMSKKNFCHIRFSAEDHIKNAIYFSGYRIKIENKDDAPNTGRLHVDYAQARDDQYEYECRQRCLQREARHRERMEHEISRPPSPPPVVHYSDHEASILSEKLRNEDTFLEGATVLTTWFERGECNKRNSNVFYSFLQSANGYIRYLQNEKKKSEEARDNADASYKKRLQSILLQIIEVQKIYVAAKKQKTWDQFSKPQRKNVSGWEKDIDAAKDAHIAEGVKHRIEDEMDVSDGEGEESMNNPEEAMLTVADQPEKKVGQSKDQKSQEELDNLRCQLEASVNEFALLKSETDKERESRSRQLEVLQEAVCAMQQEIQLFIQKKSKDEDELKELRALKLKVETDTKLEKEKETGESSVEREDDKNLNMKDIVEPLPENEVDILAFASSVTAASSNLLAGTEHEARLICLISTFLNVHPFGASVDYICSWLHQVDDGTIRARDVENLMRRYPCIFMEECTGIGASLEKKWRFCGFRPLI